MTLYSYVVARDYGFAPNPFQGYCTLATCKPGIRKSARPGDWIIGTGSAAKKRTGTLVFAMQVQEVLTFDQYWIDERFVFKRPNIAGSLKQAFGDNIYHHGSDGQWTQEDSHHSLPDGTSNQKNISTDTGRTDRVLVATKFAYFGAAALKIPREVRVWDDIDLCVGRGYKCRFPQPLIDNFLRWLESIEQHGVIAPPFDWPDSGKSDVRLASDMPR